MNRRVQLIVLAAAVFGLFGAGVTAYTSFTADRDVTMDVVTDDKGILQIEADNDATFVTQSSEGDLEIDVTQGGASGVNVNSTLALGDNSSATTKYAFNVTNNDNNAHSVKFSYAVDGTDSDSGDNVNFHVFDASGNSLKSFSEESSSTVSMSSGETVYVVVKVNTTGVTSSDDLSGTLTMEST